MKKENESIEKIMRGEMSACEAYTKAIEKVENQAEVTRLKELRVRHQEALDFWKTQAELRSNETPEDSGAWGKFVGAVVNTGKIFGEKATLKTMKEGEEHGLSQYKDLLEDEKITSFQKQKIRENFIPTQELNINSINAMMKHND